MTASSSIAPTLGKDGLALRWKGLGSEGSARMALPGIERDHVDMGVKLCRIAK
jgi:hypothetical protein